jgi:hypothetical protein
MRLLPTPLLLLGLCAAAQPAAAQLGLSRDNGLLGQSVTYRLNGQPFELFGLLPSFSAGPTPLALIDPSDPRLLAVGLDLLSLAVFGGLDATGQGSVTYPLPGNPNLQGLGLYAQAFTLPGALTLVDDLSAANAFALGASKTVTEVLGDLPLQVGAGHSLTLLADGRVLIAGGSVDDATGAALPGDKLILFRPSDQSFTLSAATLSHPRSAHTATRLADGRVLFLGGSDDLGAARNTGDLYDPVSDSLVAIAPMAVPRVGHTATLLADGRVFVAGGITAINGADPIASINSITNNTQRYSPALGTWSSAPNLPLPRAGHAASRLVDGRVLLSGGLEVASLFGIPLPSFSRDCRAYQPSNNTLQDLPDFTGNRTLHAQLTLSDGRVVVAGGADGNLLTQTFFSLSSVFVFNPGSNSWSAAGSLLQSRAFHSLHELEGGQVLCVGGLASVDVISLSGSPAQGLEFAPLSIASWTQPGSLPKVRPGLQSIAIDGGDRVLLIGGPADPLGGTVIGDLSAETVQR